MGTVASCVSWASADSVVTPPRDAWSMCEVCESGTTHEQRMGVIDMSIITKGYAVQGVAGEQGNSGWVYTIGLGESHGLPELVMTDSDPASAAHVVDWVVDQLLDGGSLDNLDPDQVAVGPVHQTHLDRGLLAVWTEFYGEEPEAGNTRQISLGSDLCCPGCASGQVDLSDPDSDFTVGSRLNRAQRRARDREQSRARRSK